MEETTNDACVVKGVDSKKSKIKRTKKERFSSSSCRFVRGRSLNFSKGKADIYVSNKTNFKALINKCEKLLDNDEEEIFIHGLGTAVTKACHLALQLRERHENTLDHEITTSTVDIADDFIPETDEDDFQFSLRKCSAIHIRIYRKIPLTSLKFKK